MLTAIRHKALLVLGCVLVALVMAACGGGSQTADVSTPEAKVVATTDVPITNTPAPRPTGTLTVVSPVPTATSTQVPAIVGTVSFQVDVQEVAPASQLGMGSIVNPSLIRLKDGRYQLYLQARAAGLTGEENRELVNIISLISTDGIRWDAGPGIRIQHGSLTDIDSEAGEPNVYLGLDDKYYMAYTGRYMGVNKDGKSQKMHRVVFAVSDDGLNWSKLNQYYADPQNINDFASSADVNVVNGRYVIYYTGQRNIIRATSKDGLTWVRQEVTVSAGHDSTLVKYDGLYYMFAKMPEALAYARNPDPRLDLLVMAISQDGVNWSHNYYQVVVKNADDSEVTAENLQDPGAILLPDGSLRIFLNNDRGKAFYSIKPSATLPKLTPDLVGDGRTKTDQPRQTPTNTPTSSTRFKPSLEPIVQNIPIERAVSYGSGATVDGPPADLLLDLFLPDTGGLGPRPLAVFIHPGGFTGGSRIGPGLAKQAAQRGWVAASIDYRLEGDNPLPGPRMQKMLDALGGPSSSALYRSVVAAVEDTLTALDYLLGRADELDIDSNRIVLIGASAGAITALNVAYAADNFGIDRPDIAAVVDLWGSIPESFGEESTMDPGEPPLFIIHGTEDTVVEFTRALNLVRGAESVGIPYEFHPQEGAEHGFGGIDPGTNTTADGRSLESAVFEFLDRVLYQSEIGVP